MSTIAKPKTAEIELLIPVSAIDRDPNQPRIDADDELKSSIEARGVLQAIIVRAHPDEKARYMIVDGERRWRGAKAAGLRVIKAVVSTKHDNPAERLIDQLAANTGKPLTPIEEAMAFAKIMAVNPKLTQVQLAAKVGKPRSLVGDRLRMLELDPVWIGELQSGRLQTSHAPILHLYRAVPSEYQAKAAENMADNYHISSYIKDRQPIPIEKFKHGIHQSFRDYIKRIDDVPGYKGPTIEIEDEHAFSGPKKQKWAADPALWRPIANRLAKKRKKEQRRTGGERAPRKPGVWLKDMPESVQQREVSGAWSNKEGETLLYTDDQYGGAHWAEGIDPTALLPVVDPERVIVERAKGSGSLRIYTTDAAAVQASRRAYRDRLVSALNAKLAKSKAQLLKALDEYPVTGAGVRMVLGAIADRRSRDELQVLAIALGIELPILDIHHTERRTAIAQLDQVAAERLLAAWTAYSTEEIELPQMWQVRDAIDPKIRTVWPKLKAAAPKKAKDVDAQAIKAAIEHDVEQEEEELAGVGA